MPDPTSQFWLNLTVQCVVAVGTVGAVFAALFGKSLRMKVWPPKLSLSLSDPDGEKTVVRLVPPGTEAVGREGRLEDARYYRLRVSNGRRLSSTANQVQVVLLRIEEPAADGREFVVTWAGELPLTWMNQPLFPLLRTIGPSAQVDLCSVVKHKWIELHPLIKPLHLELQRRQSTHLILWVQAKSNEVDSSVMRIQVSWDGKWKDGAHEMRQHLVLKVLDQAMS